MYTMPANAFLQMTEVRTHEELADACVLAEFDNTLIQTSSSCKSCKMRLRTLLLEQVRFPYLWSWNSWLEAEGALLLRTSPPASFIFGAVPGFEAQTSSGL